MSVQTNFKGNILNRQKQGNINKFSYYLSHSETLLYYFFKKSLFSHIESLIKSFLVLCINLVSLKTLFAQNTSQPCVNREG